LGSLKQLAALVSVPPSLPALIAEGPTAATAGCAAAPDRWEARAADLATLGQQALVVLRDAAAVPAQRKRRRCPPRNPTRLTAEQTEAVQLVGEHKGNITAAARAAGKSRQAMKKLYDKAMKKLGAAGVKNPRTKALPTDRRGQIDVSDDKAPDPTEAG
jgi:hypothetical protein